MTIKTLDSLLGDRLLRPGTGAFDDALRVEFAGAERIPAAVVQVHEQDDVVAAVRIARESALSVAVRSGGHSYARHGLGDGGALLIDLRGLGDVEIDPGTGIGWAGGGATVGAYTNRAGQNGLATGFGDATTAGITGVTLGGGIGYLSRRDGLSLDNVISAEVVLAGGDVVVADAEQHPDLFWALRGGGGNFGVITRLGMRLSPTPVVTGGLLAFEPDPGVLAAAVDVVLAAPDGLSAMINVMKAPPLPMIPEHLHGKPLIAVILCWSGVPERAAAAVGPLRNLAPIVADTVEVKPYPAMFEGVPPRAGDVVYPAQRTGFVDTIDVAWAERAIATVATSVTPIAVINLRPMGGAIARVEQSATAFAHRGRAVMTTVAAQFTDPALTPAVESWTVNARRALGLDGAGYLNFMATATSDDVTAAYPAATLERLREVKRCYDPENVFRSNHNIRPAATPTS